MGAFVTLDAGDDAVLSVERLRGKEAWTHLLAGTFNKKLIDRERLGRQFAATRAWTAEVPVLRCSYRWSLDGLVQVRDTIVDAVASLQLTSA